jgi:hypothetical protein
MTKLLSAMQLAAIDYIRQGFAITPSVSSRMMGSDKDILWLLNSHSFLDRIVTRFIVKVSKCSLPPYSKYVIQTEEDAIAVFARHPLANIQIATGKKSGLAVLDVDFYRKDHLRLSSISLPQTRKSKTGRGEHFFFLYPQDAPFTRRHYKKNFILGDECKVTVPPSIHVNQNVYSWENTLPFMPLPDELMHAPKAVVSHVVIYHYYRRMKDRFLVTFGLPFIRFYIRIR